MDQYTKVQKNPFDHSKRFYKIPGKMINVVLIKGVFLSCWMNGREPELQLVSSVIT